VSGQRVSDLRQQREAASLSGAGLPNELGGLGTKEALTGVVDRRVESRQRL
jgi:hypothetical protein